MDKLIEALQIFIKYGNPQAPTNCEKGVLQVAIDPNIVSKEDIKKLDELGFSPTPIYRCRPEYKAFQSYFFGSV